MNIDFDKHVFCLEAALATAYWCADRIVADVSVKDDLIHVVLTGRNGYKVSSTDVEDFKTMIVHNQIRHLLSVQFAPLEQAIVEKAFSPVRGIKD